MTLSEMIKKYEGIKVKLEQEYKKDAITQIETVEAILEDLHNVETHPSTTVLCGKILKQIDKALENDDPDGAQIWAHVLQMLPQ